MHFDCANSHSKRCGVVASEGLLEMGGDDQFLNYVILFKWQAWGLRGILKSGMPFYIALRDGCGRLSVFSSV